MTIKTELTESFGLEHPSVLAPMGNVSGGSLAAAVSNAGGLGLAGGGDWDRAWVSKETSLAGAEATRGDQPDHLARLHRVASPYNRCRGKHA